MTAKDRYWAGDEAKICASHLLSHNLFDWGDLYQNTFKMSWVRNFLAYYSPIMQPGRWDTSLSFQGEQGELIRMFTPEARLAISRLKAVITKQRLAFEAIAQTQGTDVVQEINFGNALADQIVQNERLDLVGPTALEGALVCGNWFIKTIWSTERGDAIGYRNSDGKILRAGGPEITAHSVFDVFYDPDYTAPGERPWMLVRNMRNRWDLVAEHPELADKIKSLPSAQEVLGASFWFDIRYVNHDTVVVWEFYHRPSPAIPDGRILIFSDADCIYYNDINKYGCIPIEEMMPEHILTTGLGYPKLTDLLSTQEMFDNTMSAIATNSSQFAVQNVLIPRNANIGLQELNGMRFIQYTPESLPGGGKPEALNLSATSPETFKFAEMLSQKIEKLSMVNGAIQGNPPPGVTSGTAIATLSASAIEAIAPYTLCYYYCLEKTMMHALNAYQKFGKIPQKLRLSGKYSHLNGKMYNNESIKNLSGIKIVPVNSLLVNPAGRLEIAEKLMGMPKELWGDYVSIIDGQPLSNITKGQVSKTDNILAENEALANGKPVIALATDNHPAHITKHADMLSDPDVRFNAEYSKEVLDHIMEHFRLMKETDPELMYVIQTGQMPPQGQMPQGMPGQPPQIAVPNAGPLPADKLQPPQVAVTPPTQMPRPKMAAPANPAADLLGRM